MAESLSDKLKSLHVQLGAANLKPKKPAQTGYGIETVVDGYELDTAFGATFVSEKSWPLDYSHGVVSMTPQADLTILSEWGHLPGLKDSPLQKLVFLDTETSGLAGGTGTFAFLIGLGFLTETGFRVVQLFMRDPSREPALLAGLTHFLDGFETVVTFNGKSFDVPLLNGRHVLNGFTSPLRGMPHLDMLPMARRLWRNRLPSRTLGDLEREILQIGRADEEVPGWMIPEIYFEYLKTGDARPLAGVLYHNAEDVLSLAALLVHVARMFENPTAGQIPHGLDLVAIARLYEDLGRIDTALKLYEIGLERDIPRDFYVDTILRYAAVYRRREEWPQAARLWERAAAAQSVEACVELAKYHEHVTRDLTKALLWADQAQAALNSASLSPYALRQALHDLEHRRDRIAQKLARQAAG